jgi:hypothetical protein
LYFVIVTYTFLLTAKVEYIYPFVSILQPIALTCLSEIENGASRYCRGKCYSRSHPTARYARLLLSERERSRGGQVTGRLSDIGMLHLRLAVKVVANTAHDGPFAEPCA